MADISACSGVRDKKDKCPLRHNCKRYEAHLEGLTKSTRYVMARFNDDNTCEMIKPL